MIGQFKMAINKYDRTVLTLSIKMLSFGRDEQHGKQANNAGQRG